MPASSDLPAQLAPLRPLQAAGHLGLWMRRVMLAHNAGELRRTRRAQSFGADPRVISVDPVAAREGRPGPLQSTQGPRRDRPQENGQAALDHREVRLALSKIV